MASILLIEDNDQIRQFARIVLENAGHEVREAPDGEAGLRAFRQRPAELVICDLIMPIREGLEMIAELRRGGATVPILAMSGGGTLGDPNQMLAVARALGATRTLPKPFSPNELVSAVEQLLNS